MNAVEVFYFDIFIDETITLTSEMIKCKCYQFSSKYDKIVGNHLGNAEI